MPTTPASRPFDVFEKAPERRRRSRFSRWRHRPLHALATGVVVAVALVVFGYAGLRLTHSLPSQRRAQRMLTAGQRVVASPVFASAVTQPLEQFLADGLPIARNTGPFANFVARSVDGDLAMKSVVPPARPVRSELIQNWRAVIAALDQRDVHVYGVPSALLRGDARLREFVASRLAQTDPALARIGPQTNVVDLGVAALVKHFGISASELYGIAFVAERAQKLRSPAAR